MSAEKTKPIPKAEQIYWLLRQAIVHLEMEPGAVISEKDLCAELGVSRTPVREALQRLADEGLVDIFPHSGTYVSRISFTVAEEGFVIRRALEIESVRKAVANVSDADVARLKVLIGDMQAILDNNQLDSYLDCDDAFHSAIAGISGYPRIWKFITLAKVHLDRMRQLSAPVPGHLVVVTEQHDTIVRALANRNADQAELAMRIHLDTSFAVMARMYEDQRGLFERKDAP
ncbi:GntR family transcriptional regulator [Allorhizobium taibaishanense]|uniref:GntR family transcriptional regulator n=1 Tax=Allorhizobium taibaishanense TaxID=887144 RepID=A0A1Q9A042_9HYPH|nr:GntR family transcriptional regulator [Allorhizobium taibaishanense]OLP47936.1 GntR family transcriptional regulator [Allorhizobium taibaishanense]